MESKKPNKSHLASIIRKNDVFEPGFMGHLFRQHKASIGSIMLSSGSSGHFSMGLITRKELKKAPQETDLFLSRFFGAKKNETLIINASAMGIRVFSNFAISDTGPRADIVICLLKTVAPHYEKIFIVGDPLFIKQMSEESKGANVDWGRLKCWFISGGDWMPESLRQYVHFITKRTMAKPENGFWFGVCGLTELGYPIFFETEELVQWRLKTKAEKGKVQPAGFYPRCTTPFLFHYLPSKYLVEELADGQIGHELVFSTLDKERIVKLKRYASGDWGEIFNKNNEFGIECPLPLVRFWGRLNNFLSYGEGIIHVTDIKELIFERFEIASMVSGYFLLYKNKGKPVVDIQLKRGIDQKNKALEELRHYLESFYDACIMVRFKPFHQMHPCLTLDMEHKFNPLNLHK